MKIAKHIVTLMMFASVSALAQTEVVPASTTVPDSTQAKPVAEAPEVAAPEIVPADSAVVDSTAQNAEPELIEENREAVAEATAETVASVVDSAAVPVSDSTVASVADSTTAPVADSVKSEEVVAVATPDSAKPQVDSIAPVDTVSVAVVDTPAVKVDSVPVAKKDEPVASPLDNILHGNSYNPVANEAAAATVGGEMWFPHKMFNRRFAYFEPVEQEGVVSFGQSMTYFVAFNNNYDLALLTAGLAKENFGVMLRAAVGKKWSYIDDDETGAEQTMKATSAGTALGGTASARFAGLDMALRLAYYQPEGDVSITGSGTEIESDVWNFGGQFIISKPGRISWGAALSVARYNSKNSLTEKSMFEKGGRYYLATTTIHTTDSTTRVEVVPEFNFGGAILSHEKARVFMGLNMAAPLATYDRIKNVCSRHNEYALVATPNILGEVMLGSHVVAYGSASHQWDVFHYRDSYINKVSTKSMDISSGITTANVGMRLEYEMAALEVAFTKQFLSNPFGAFSSTDEVMTSIGMFINF